MNMTQTASTRSLTNSTLVVLFSLLAALLGLTLLFSLHQAPPPIHRNPATRVAPASDPVPQAMPVPAPSERLPTATPSPDIKPSIISDSISPTPVRVPTPPISQG